MNTLSLNRSKKAVTGLLILFSLFLFYSCEKEVIQPEVIPDPTYDRETGLKSLGDGEVDYSVAQVILDAVNYDEIQINPDLGALSFSTSDILTTTIGLIEEASAALDDEIISSITGLSNDEILAMNINYDFAFEYFESHYPEFFSHRAKKAQELDAFLEIEFPDGIEDPRITYIAIPDAYGTVLNEYGEIITMDGTESIQQIHVSRNDGVNYTILSGDPLQAIELREGGFIFSYINTDPSIKIMDDGGGGDNNSSGGSVTCKSYRSNDDTDLLVTGGTIHRATYTITVRNNSFPWGYHGVYSELFSDRWHFIWRWRNHITQIDIDQTGTVRDSKKCTGAVLSCAASGNVNFHKHKVQAAYSNPISTVNQVGGSNFPRANFAWEGQNYNLDLW